LGVSLSAGEHHQEKGVSQRLPSFQLVCFNLDRSKNPTSGLSSGLKVA